MRKSGILLHISSLPSPYGIGTLGKAAYDFIDFLKASGVSVWQMLPIGPTGYGDSPYQSFSAFAGNPYFIDLDMLCDEGMLDKTEIENIDFGSDSQRIDYGKLYAKRFDVLRRAYDRGKATMASVIDDFFGENDWLCDYALYMAIKNELGGIAWMEWPNELRMRETKALDKTRMRLNDEIRFIGFMQYEFSRQWDRLREYANQNGVSLLGDIPIYTALDSSDVWANPNVFQLDENKNPAFVAGVPPDYFSEDGQLWGNPLYNWENIAKTDYDWWVKRIARMLSLFDMLRIDHFIGFARYYAICANAQNAKVGEWHKGPGKGLFDVLKNKLGNLPIIAEDLGLVTDSVRELLRYCDFPGMKVLEFAFGADGTNMHLPHNIPENTAYYIATHDNDTAAGWWNNAQESEKAFTLEYIGLNDDKNIIDALLKTLYRSNAVLSVVQMQDILGLSSEARMNLPATCGGNWCYRAQKADFTKELSDKLYRMSLIYSR